MINLSWKAAAGTVKDWCGRPMNDFPLVTVTNNQLISDATFSQQPYNDVERLPPNNTFGYTWPIPFYWKNYRYYYKNNETSLKWLTPAYETCAKSAIAPNNRAIHWDMGNAESTSYLRVDYDDIGYTRLLEQLKARRDIDFSTADKVHLIGDQLAIATERDRNGLPFSYHKVLDLITTILPKYPHYATFKIAQDFIDSMERLFMDGPDYELFKAGIRRWLEENYNILGYNTTGNWNNEQASEDGLKKITTSWVIIQLAIGTMSKLYNYYRHPNAAFMLMAVRWIFRAMKTTS
uniref:ERAP1_C domain-containing protein n=1 Tax=Ascaris lumbricoides TaxID=6252 RepID=A0A0M3IP79_ASCLU